ncbi:LA_0364 family Cys-rich lipoprotein [Leptospira sp. GIMC2001]|uniref:LA_0364 family Cys-rich lipoprotein n=1 Tax=Leptospira sp. GIMC2001 TaxID=1513297 RepID=UPI003FA5D291
MSFGIALALQIQCGTPLSFREECYERNKCSEIESNCYLQNSLFFRFTQGDRSPAGEDVAILLGTCDGLEKTCRKNCESSTIF